MFGLIHKCGTPFVSAEESIQKTGYLNVLTNSCCGKCGLPEMNNMDHVCDEKGIEMLKKQHVSIQSKIVIDKSEKKHYSDCVIHNEPAEPKGECNCGGYMPSKSNTIEEWESAFDMKVIELKSQRPKHLKECEPVEFGYSIDMDDSLFRVVDFGNIKKFIRSLLSAERKKNMKEFIAIQKKYDDIVEEYMQPYVDKKLEDERNRIVKIGENLKEYNHRCNDGCFETCIVSFKNEAITDYQSKIKN